MNSTKQTITRKELIEKLSSFKGAKIATVITETVPDMNKTRNPYYGDVAKLSRMNVMFNASYGNAIAKKAVAQLEPSLAKKTSVQAVVQPRTWGKRIDKTCLIEHEDKTYVEVRFMRPARVVYVNNNTGNEIETDLLTPFLRKRAEQVIPIATINLDNVRGLIVDKIEYLIK